MDKDTIINYWVDTSNRDYQTMLNLYKSKDYHWSLFIGHLVIEKLLKGIYVKNVDDNPPRIHDLLRLAEKAKINTTEEQKDTLDLITTFNINARYPDYNQSFYKKCDHEFTTNNIEKIKELRKWLLLIVKKE
ncbi:HEPN domain protein [Tepidanaerobacter acetatoxydans Re1]|uniref:HEPN domain protein n=1 Tax=Tepidanaerobacter acetatoxydans (strain DSM 21804 / JCM 16047 / Re1) TaxID=1209989 RepID=F4LXF0_TEPAE|nr:HEPN domain-containing protein [Tepidanaerobacter acetatoxydans]AEE91052.1 HEPN domain protein [Tepidanaerobacter acetatoxydans Re1]CCP25669.1 HEPN domain protein [Tepidanaerobacter acetatoxydans Re1]